MNDDFRVKAIRDLRKMFFEDNPKLTEFEKMAWEFYYEVQELWHGDPEWARGVTEMAETIKKIKAQQFKSAPPEDQNTHK